MYSAGTLNREGLSSFSGSHTILGLVELLYARNGLFTGASFLEHRPIFLLCLRTPVRPRPTLAGAQNSLCLHQEKCSHPRCHLPFPACCRSDLRHNITTVCQGTVGAEISNKVGGCKMIADVLKWFLLFTIDRPSFYVSWVVFYFCPLPFAHFFTAPVTSVRRHQPGRSYKPGARGNCSILLSSLNSVHSP